jgi:hypothetical protein
VEAGVLKHRRDYVIWFILVVMHVFAYAIFWSLLKHALCLTVTLQPAKKNAYAQSGDNVFTPVERELIFDIVSHLHC